MKQKYKIPKKLLSVFLTVLLVFGMIPVTEVTAADTSVPCETDGCTGTYENGICTVDDSHHQSATLDTDGYYEIGNLGQLLWFANQVNTVSTAKNGKLVADIDATSVSAIGIGSLDSNAFAGVFDGNNKKLTIKLSSSSEYLAVFPYINGATVKNLTVDGEVNASNHFAGGIVGRVSGGNTTLENCLSLITLNSSFDGDGTHGGLISIVGGGTTTINNCAFAGKMIGTKTGYCGGFVGWTDKSAKTNISNSYVSATFNLENNSGDTFGRNQSYVSIENCYYLNALSDRSVAVQKTSESFASGEVAYLLNGSSTSGVWKQTIGEDATPNFTGSTVYTYKNCIGNADYSNEQLSDLTHSSYVNGICKACGDYQYAVKNDSGVYEIGNLGQLMWFASQVNSGAVTAHSVVLTDDITIDNSVVWTPINLPDSSSNASTFDGDGHTITFANTKEDSVFGLFGKYNYSTIKNLYLDGSITCNQSDVLGVVVNTAFATKIQNVISTVNITNSGSASTGGIAGRFGGKASSIIEKCAVYGDVSSAGRAGGFIGENWGGTQYCIVRYSAYKGDVTGSVQGTIIGYNGLQSKCYSRFTRVYYCENDGLDICGATNGGYISQSYVDAKTASQFESGEVTYLLNGSSSSGVWKQTLGTDDLPNFTGKTVYCGYMQCDETIHYKNEPLRNSAHDYDADGICTSVEGEIHYMPATLNDNGTADDTTDDYYAISKAGQLYWFAEFVNKGNNTANAKLTADIDLKNREWTPIGIYSDTKPDSLNNVVYKGTFDGQKHTISNLKVNMTSTYEAGLFSRIQEATVKNLGVINATVESTQGVRVGVIAGEIYKSTVENVYTKGTISVSTGSDENAQAGGIAGEGAGSTFTSCYTTYGMLVSNDASDEAKVANCFYLSDVANESSYGENKTTNQFEDGEVTYLLNGDQSTIVWKQTIGTDKLPGFDGEQVYTFKNCKGNTVFINEQLEDGDHSYKNGFCTFCGGYEEPTLNEDGYYEIDNAGKLYWFAAKVNGVSRQINGKLTADITVNAGKFDKDGNYTPKGEEAVRVWTPIGNSSNSYRGKFDGKKNDNENYTVSGLYFNDTATDYVGLFGHLYSTAEVKNIGVVNSYFNAQKYVGGVVGENDSSTVTNCYNTGSVTGTEYVGGVVGCNYYNGTVTNCYNTGSVTGTSHVGGIVGRNYNNSTVTNCYNTGSVTGTSYVGGVVGRNYYNSTVTNSYNTGSVTGTRNVGGVVGYNGSDGKISNCYYLKGCVGENNGIGGSDSDVDGQTTVKTADQFASGEVTYLLNGDQDIIVWKQTIGTDKLPGFDGEQVYTYQKCDAKPLYANEQLESGEHVGYENGFCKGCGGYEEPTLNEDGYYEIDNAGKLYWFAAKVNGGSRQINGKLTANITVNAGTFDKNGNYTPKGEETVRAWTPIGNSSNNYEGKFDGKKNDNENYTVSGLYFNDTATDYVGLFGNLYNNAEVKNVGVVNSYFNAKNYVGGVVGRNYKSTVTNCYNTGSVTGTNCVGGVVGYNHSSTVTNCYNTGSVTGMYYVGGVVGRNYYNSTVTNSYNTGSVTGTNYVGGVVGCNYDNGTVTNCYNTGSVTGTNSVSGVVGYNYSSTVTNSYNTGSVTGTNDVGGVVGWSYPYSTVTNCYYLKGCAGEQNGIGGSDSDVDGQTTVKTADQFASGEVAYLLQDGVKGKLLNDDEENPVYGEPLLVWGQSSNKEGSLPILTSNEEYRVLPIMSGDTALAYTVLRKGDINNDAKVDVDDYQQVINISLSGNSKKTDADAYDLNGDGVINVLDCAIAKSEGISQDKYNLLLEAVKASETTLCYCKNADINGDGIVNILDCSLLELMLGGTVDTIR